MTRKASFTADCGRLFDTVSSRYQNRVRNLENRLRTAFWYQYQNSVRNVSYYPIVLPPGLGGLRRDPVKAGRAFGRAGDGQTPGPKMDTARTGVRS